MRSLVALLAAVAAAVGGLALLRKRRGGSGERVDLYFDDGSMVSLPGASSPAGDLVALAHEALGRP